MIKIKETAKSLILMLLVTLMLILSAQIMLFERLNSAGFTETTQMFFRSIGMPGIAQLFKSEISPSELSYSTGRFVYPASMTIIDGGDVLSAIYSRDNVINAYSSVSGLLTGILKQEPVKEENVNFNALTKQRGILIDIGRTMSMDVFLRVSENTQSKIQRLLFRYCYITTNNDGVVAFVKNEETGDIYSFKRTDKETFSSFDDIIINAKNKNFYQPVGISRDINIDKVSLPSYFVYPLSGTQKFYPISSSNPLFSKTDNVFYANMLSEVLQLFGFNYNSIRRDTEKDGSVIYVENFSSITISPSGRAIFTTSQSDGGIALSSLNEEPGDTGYRVQDIIIAAHTFLGMFDSRLTGGADSELRFKTIYFEPETGDCVIDFDYVVDGIPVLLNGQNQYAARLKYANGYFVEADITFREYTKTQEAFSMMELPSAIYISRLKRPGRVNLNSYDIVYEDFMNENLINPKYLIGFKD